MARIRDMTTGNPTKMIITFALPLMAGNIFQQLYTVVDTAIVGKYLGVAALAAVGAADWLNWCMLGTVQGFTQGFGIRMAQNFGARDIDRLKNTVGNSAVLSVILSVVLVLFGQLIAEPTLRFLQTPEDIIGGSLTYIRIMFLGTPIVMLYNYLASVLRALGDSKTPLMAMAVASIANIVLDFLFVMGFGLGIAGAATATLIAQLISSVYCLYFIRKIEFLKLDRSKFTLRARIMSRLFMLGLPMAFQNAIIGVGGMIVQFVVNGFGVIFIAGFVATNKLYGILEIAAISYGYAMVTYTGQNMGAGKTQRIRKGVKSALGIALITSVVIGAVMIFLGKYILSCFISGEPDVFDSTLKVAYEYLFVMSASLPVLYLLHIIRSAIQGLGNTIVPMLSGVAEFIMRTGSALVLPIVFAKEGLYFAETFAWIGADIILVVGYMAVTRKLKIR